MKKHSVWRKIQAILCFAILLCVFAPLALIAVSPSTAVGLLTGALLDDAMSQAVAGITWMQRAVIGAGVLIGVLCALRMLTLMFSRPHKDRAGVSLTNATEGEIHISVPAVETLVSEGIRDVPGLSDVRMKVFDHRDSISIEITMSARSDINIPETMMRLQTRIKNYVQESAGVEVSDVRLNVDRVVLADPVPALPAGRGRRAAAAAAQSAAQPVAEASQPEVERRGLFGRKGARRREEKREPEPAPAAEEASVSDFLRSYENGGEPVTPAEPAAAPAEAPAAMPVEAEAEVSAESTVEAEAEAPIDAPIEVEAEAPIDAPIEAEAEAPVDAPIEAEAEAPIDAPIEVEAEAPIYAPIEVEAEAPTDASIDEEAEDPFESFIEQATEADSYLNAPPAAIDADADMEPPAPIVIGDTADDIAPRAEEADADERRADGSGAIAL